MSTKIKNRHRLKTKDIDDIIEELNIRFQQSFFDKTASVETGDLEGFQVIIINDDIDFFRVENMIMFTLRGVTKYKLTTHRVVVDMGAIRFITNGADIMAAGIVDADPDIKENDGVWVCDETHHKPLAVGTALVSGPSMLNEKTGKAVKNFHYVGDLLWNLTKIQA